MPVLATAMLAFFHGLFAAADHDDTTVTVNLVFVLIVLAIIALLVWIFWGWRRRRP